VFLGERRIEGAVKLRVKCTKPRGVGGAHVHLHPGFER
jgi:hypothetical protein